jgi:hypothetical protein
MARSIDRDLLIVRTLSVLQPRAPRMLTEEDARESVENVAGLFRLLHQWATAERRGQSPADHERQDPGITNGIADGRRPCPGDRRRSSRRST